MPKNKKELLKECDELGISGDEEMTNKQLEDLIEATKQADSGKEVDVEPKRTNVKIKEDKRPIGEDSDEKKNFPPQKTASKEKQAISRQQTVANVTPEQLKKYQEEGNLVGWNPKDKIAKILA